MFLTEISLVFHSHHCKGFILLPIIQYLTIILSYICIILEALEWKGSQVALSLL